MDDKQVLALLAEVAAAISGMTSKEKDWAMSLLRSGMTPNEIIKKILGLRAAEEDEEREAKARLRKDQRPT